MGVLFYFGMLYVFEMKDTTVKKDLANLGPVYTNSSAGHRANPHSQGARKIEVCRPGLLEGRGGKSS